MDHVAAFNDVVQIACESRDPTSGWNALVQSLVGRSGARSLQLPRVDIEGDVAAVRKQLQMLVEAEPPPPGLNCVYFGLFDAVDGGVERAGYYVAGVAAFDSEDGDSLCDPKWWPKGRYLTSSAIDAIKSAELVLRADGSETAVELLAYAGELGAAMIVSRFASEDLFVGLRRVVGFDSGDFAELPS